MTPVYWSGNPAGMDERDIIDLLELQRLTRGLLDHLTAMFSMEEAVELRRYCRLEASVSSSGASVAG